MTDKELLMFAAKSTRLVLWATQDDKPGLLAHGGDKPVRWNPLDDDGDALRMAIILGLSITNTAFQIRVSKPGCAGVTEPHGEDIFDATRRAIVLAAAEIGLLNSTDGTKPHHPSILLAPASPNPPTPAT